MREEVVGLPIVAPLPLAGTQLDEASADVGGYEAVERVLALLLVPLLVGGGLRGGLGAGGHEEHDLGRA